MYVVCTRTCMYVLHWSQLVPQASSHNKIHVSDYWLKSMYKLTSNVPDYRLKTHCCPRTSLIRDLKWNSAASFEHRIISSSGNSWNEHTARLWSGHIMVRRTCIAWVLSVVCCYSTTDGLESHFGRYLSPRSQHLQLLTQEAQKYMYNAVTWIHSYVTTYNVGTCTCR